MPVRVTNDTSNYLAFGKQTNKDTEATTFYFLRHLEGSGHDTDPDINSVREGGGGQEVSFNYKQSQKSSGQANAYSRPELAGRSLTGVLGVDVASTVTATNGGLAFHRQTPAATIPYYTFEQAAADTIERVAACKFASLDIELEAGQPVKISAGYVAGGTYTIRDIASVMTASRESVGVRHHYPGASVVVDGSGNSDVTKIKIGVERGLDDGIQTTALTMDDVVELTQAYNVDYTMQYVDKTLYQKLRAGAGGSVIQAALPTGALDVYIPGYGANASYALRVVAPLLEYVGAKLNRLDPDGKTMFLDVSAMAIPGGTTTFFTENWAPFPATAAY